MRTARAHALLAAGGLVLWLVLIVAPLAAIVISSASSPVPLGNFWTFEKAAGVMLRSLVLALVIAAASVVLGYVPGRILGTARRGQGLLFCLVLAPLLLPQYLLYYVWSLPLAPTTPLGRFLAEQPQAVAAWVGTVTSGLVLALWYWPLVALVLAQGWRNLDAEVLAGARLDGGPLARLRHVTMPLLRAPLMLAATVAFAQVFIEYGAFHLAGVRTIGTELGVLYEETGSTAAVARAAWPVVVLAMVAAAVVSRTFRDISAQPPMDRPGPASGPLAWIVLGVLVGVTLLAPLGILVGSVSDLAALRQFWSLQWDGLETSLASAILAAILALALAGGALAVERVGGPGSPLARAAGLTGRVMQFTILLAAFLPGYLVGGAILAVQSFAGLPQTSPVCGIFVLAAGQAARFAAVAMIVLLLARDGLDRHFREMAGVDGAGPLEAWRHVYLPLVWPLVAGAGLVVAMLSLTELPTTLVLLAPGLPDFTQRLLNQMHYARDQHVIASCLMLVGVYLTLAVVVAALKVVAATRSSRPFSREPSASAFLLLACALLGALAGCDSGASPGQPNVLAIIGRTGSGPGEFLYPRAIDLAADGTLYVADKTGRIQHLAVDGAPLGEFRMPDTEKGFPTGLSVGPDGNVWVADTHCHRIMVFAPDGTAVRQFGSFGTGDGRVIYPTDVAFLPDGRVLVSEYGGNDRITVWSADGKFLASFGRLGPGEGEFSRPAAMAVDAARGVLYVADACNHRVAKYTFAGNLIGYLGAVGQGPGELRYPYGLALEPDGTLLVCEYGNNRVQKFAPDGRSLGCLGAAGRGPGQLAYPWAVAVGGPRVYVVDAGNNRIQVWRR